MGAGGKGGGELRGEEGGEEGWEPAGERTMMQTAGGMRKEETRASGGGVRAAQSKGRARLRVCSRPPRLRGVILAAARLSGEAWRKRE